MIDYCQQLVVLLATLIGLELRKWVRDLLKENKNSKIKQLVGS